MRYVPYRLLLTSGLAIWAGTNAFAQSSEDSPGTIESADFSAIEAAAEAGDLATVLDLVDDFFDSVYTGTITVTGSNCLDPADNGSDSGQASVVFINDNGVLSGFGSLTDADGEDGGVFALELTVDGSSVSGKVLTSSGEFPATGSLTDSALTLQVSGVEDSDLGGCTVSASGVLTRTDFTSALTENSTPVEITAQTNLVTNTRAVISAVSSRIAAIFGGIGGGRANALGMRYDAGNGLAGGDVFAGLPIGVWGSYTRSDFSDAFTATAFDGDRNLAMAGLDISPLEDMVLGLSLGYEDTNLETRFNSGEVESDGVIISPYAAYRWAENYQIDAIFGYTSIDTDQVRNLTATPITSDTASDRFFWAGNFTVSQPWQNWLFAGRFGMLWVREFIDGFQESNGATVADKVVELSQWRFGGDAAYSWGDFEPFASVTYERDFSRAPLVPGSTVPGDDRDGVVIGAGVRYFNASGLTGTFEWNTIEGRDSYSEDSYTFLLRYQF